MLIYLLYQIKTLKKKKMKIAKQINKVTIDQFTRDLETCLTILKEPTKKTPYYVCEYISPALYKTIIHVTIK